MIIEYEHFRRFCFLNNLLDKKSSIKNEALRIIKKGKSKIKSKQGSTSPDNVALVV